MPSATAHRSEPTGLTDAEVAASRSLHGENVLTPPARTPWWRQFLEKFSDPVIRILLIAAALAIAVGAVEQHYWEGIGILVAVFLATTLAFFNEYRAGQEFDLLNRVSDDVPVEVVRAGRRVSVPRRAVVVGDVASLEPGEEVPADGRVIRATTLTVNESALTGEAEPVAKQPAGDAPRPAAAAHGPASGSAEAAGLVFRGTLVTDGHGLFRVTAVGDATEVGRTARAAGEETGDVTPLNRQLDRLSRVIGLVGLTVAAATLVALVVQDVLTGSLVLSAAEGVLVLTIAAAALIALTPVWWPILAGGVAALVHRGPAPKTHPDERAPYDPAIASGAHPAVPADEAAGGGDGDDEGRGGLWFNVGAVVAGLLVAAVGLGGLAATGSLAPDGHLLPEGVAERLLGYFMIAVTIIVVAVPEGLAMSVTLSLAYSMRRMTKAGTLVRRLHACETIGAATVICSDKTGTLTRGQMRVAEVATAGQPDGTGDAGGPADGLAEGPLADLWAEAIAVNTTAHLSTDESGEVVPLGNPTEGALILWLSERGQSLADLRGRVAVADQLTFSTERKWMGTVVAGEAVVGGAARRLHIKGAPEIVLALCDRVHDGRAAVPLADEARRRTEAALLARQARALRTLGLAYRDDPPEGMPIGQGATGLVWLGFASIADPVRPEVPPAVEACRRAGIAVKMVTGDNPQTAREIARQVGLDRTRGHGPHEKGHKKGSGPFSRSGPSSKSRTDGKRDLTPYSDAVIGPDFAALSDDEAEVAAERLTVLARAKPLDKVRLVRSLQRRGHVVAVTGDGVNDTGALNYADVGLAMGRTGKAAAREASDIILLDDSFSTIVSAVMWGRSLYRNIQAFILFQLTINVVALGLALAGPFLGVDLPLKVIQMLWVNLIMDTFAALALATEPPDPTVLDRPPRRPEAFIITPPMAAQIFGTGGAFLAVLLAMLFWVRGIDEANPEYARRLTFLFTTFVMLQFWNLFNARVFGRTQSAFAGLTSHTLFLGIAAAILVGQVLIVTFGGEFFQTVPLSVGDWVTIVLGTAPVLLVGEALRGFARFRARRDRSAAPAPPATG